MSIATTMHWLPKMSAPSEIKGRIGQRCAIDRDLVGASAQELLDIGGRAHAAADGQGNEDLIGGPLDHIDHRVATVGRGSDIEEHQLVGALAVVKRRKFDRIARIAQD